MPDVHVPVLIVGGGPTGLAASVLLSRQGIRSILVERHSGTSVHPKARGLNVRTMELFRACGLEPAIRAAASELDRAVDVVWASTLLGPEIRRMSFGGAAEQPWTDSPTTFTGCMQHTLERVLYEAARSYGPAELCFGHELSRFSQDSDGVTATLVDLATGEASTLSADWVIAGDGAYSTIRTMLGIRMFGPGPLMHRMGIYFRASLREVGVRRPALVWVLSVGVLGAVNLDDLWVLQVPYDPEGGDRPEDFSAECCVEVVRRAVGLADLEVEVLSAVPWSGAAAIASCFRAGRVFLAGDAAHLIPPAGGQAMNVGVEDVHNLAWKLAGHLMGWAGAALLNTYDAERRPFAMMVNEDVAENVAARPGAPRLEQFGNRGRVLGAAYDSAAVIPDGTPLPRVANPVLEYVPTARPGHRAPHMWLSQHGQQVSTLDLFDSHFVLLAGPAGDAWVRAGEQVARQLRVPLRCYAMSPTGPISDRSGEWPTLYGVGVDGAVLVRPDGHVAWRSPTMDPDPATRLGSVLGTVLSRALMENHVFGVSSCL